GYHLELGKTLGSLGRRPEAFQHLVQAVQLDPELAEAHHYLGVLYYERGILDSAGVAFRNALELEPDRARTHAALGFLRLTQGDRAEAIGHLRRALALDPRDRTVRERLRQLGVPEK
ncbi:MAG: tetratricopeptide repeat protein, partial [Verrucomicrobiota bacterium]